MSDFRKGDVVTIHLADGTSCAGVFLGQSRRFIRLSHGRVEANDVMVDLRSERLLVPRGLVKLVEVTGK